MDDLTPSVAPETEQAWQSRNQFRNALRERLWDAFDEVELTLSAGELDGTVVVTKGNLLKAMSSVLDGPLPAVDNHFAEVISTAEVLVWAVCPRCGIAGPIRIFIEPELRVDNAGAELHLKAKSKARTHFCGQLTIPEPGQTTIEDLIGPRCGAAVPSAEVDGLVPPCELPLGHEGDHGLLPPAIVVDQPMTDENGDAISFLDVPDDEEVSSLDQIIHNAAFPPLDDPIPGDEEPTPDPDVIEGADDAAEIGPERPCPACGAMLAPADAPWSIFPEPTGGYVCLAARPADKPKRTRKPKASLANRIISADTEPGTDLLPGENLGACPWPGCELASEHPGAHQTAVDDRPEDARTADGGEIE